MLQFETNNSQHAWHVIPAQEVEDKLRSTLNRRNYPNPRIVSLKAIDTSVDKSPLKILINQKSR